MILSIQQIRQNVKSGNVLGIHNLTGLLMEFKQVRLSDGYVYRVVNAYYKPLTSTYYEIWDSLQGLTYSAHKVTLFDENMRPYTQTANGRIMHTIDPKTLIDGGFHSYSRNN